MRRIRKSCALGCWLLLAAFSLSLLPVPALAQDGPREMKLKSGFLRSLKYQIGEEKAEPIYGFFGLSFKPGFEETMSAHPAALKEAKKAFGWSGVGLVGSMALMGGALWMLMDTLGDVDDLNNDRIPKDDTNWTPVIVIGTGAVIMILGSAMAGKHLRRGVAIFNDEEAAAYGALDPGVTRVLMARRSAADEPLSAPPRLALGMRSTRDASLPGVRPTTQATLSLQFEF